MVKNGIDIWLSLRKNAFVFDSQNILFLHNRLCGLYIPDTDERKLEYLETELPFDSIISCQNCSDDLILDIDFLDLNSSLELKPDEDNENRIFDYECNLRLSLHFYRHTMISYLKDAYSTACSLSLQKQEISQH